MALPACAEDDENSPSSANARLVEKSQDAEIKPEKIDLSKTDSDKKKTEVLENQKPGLLATDKNQTGHQKTLANEHQEKIAVETMTPPTSEELAKAVRLIDFSNAARDALSGPNYSIPDKLLDYVQQYRGTWQLPKKSKISVRKNAGAALSFPKGIFNQDEEKQLAAALQEMDKALEKMIGHYRELEKYVADDSIHDDGKKGLELADKISSGHDIFMKSRESWLEIVETRAEEAERKLLYDHPLQRQILAARNIFAQMREVGLLVKTGDADKSSLATFYNSLNKIISDASKPPFPASPSLERLYRGFLKHASAYGSVLGTGIAGGFYAAKKRELNETMINCRKSYNEFVRAANALTQKKGS